MNRAARLAIALLIANEIRGLAVVAGLVSAWWATPADAQVISTAGYTPVVASSGNVANATATATIAAQAGRLNYLNNVFVTGGGATAAAVVTCTITGLQGGTISFIYGAPAGVGVMTAPLVMLFSTPIPASAANVAIVASCPALGTGNTRMVVTVMGHFK